MSRHSSRSSAWDALRAQVLQRDPICMHCRVAPSTEVDHIVPKSRGGEDSMDNCVGSCKPCNLRKGDRTLRRSLFLNSRFVV